MSWTLNSSGQSETGFSSSAQTVSLGTVTAGDLLVVFAATRASNNTATVSISDTLGNSYTQAGSYERSVSADALSCWYARSGGSGSNTVTITPSASVDLTIWAGDYTPDSTTPFDSSAGTFNNSGSTAPSPGTITVSNSGELVVAAAIFSFVSGQTVTFPSGYNNRLNYAGTVNILPMVVADSFPVSANQTPTWTLGTSKPWASIGVSFIPSSGSTNYTLNAGAGSYALSGANAAVSLGRVLSANSSTFSLLGAVAVLALNRQLSANPASFFLSGAAATPALNRRLNAAHGSFSLSGAAANLLANRRFQTVAGAFALNGAAATLTRSSGGTNYALLAGPGIFGLVGAAVTFGFINPVLFSISSSRADEFLTASSARGDIEVSTSSIDSFGIGA